MTPIALAAGCAPAPSPEAVLARRLPVVNGSYDSGDPAVGALTNGQHITCSCTLITADVVLTAAHCVPPHTPYHDSFGDIEVYFGTEFPGGGGTLVPVVDGWVHPGWNIDVIEHDVAVMRLAFSPPVAPVPFQPSAVGSAEINAQVRVVGFGATNPSDPYSIGVKHQGTTRIAERYPSFFTTAPSPSMVCGGDSGGPTFLQRDGKEVVVGVHSRADENCAEGSVETAVDDYLDVILAFTGTEIEPSCGPDAACATGCIEPDPDCPCAADGFCTEACIDAAQDPDCACPADGMCDASCAIDPDCGSCGADGMCDAACASDPDCSTDGKCDAAIPGDADCWRAGDLEDQEYEAGSGCSAAPAGNRRGWLLWTALSIALVVGRRARRAR